MSRKNLQHITIKKPAISQKPIADSSFITAESIDVKSRYSKDDIENSEHLNFAAGIPPYLRGPYSTMYTEKPWSIRQYTRFSITEERIAFYLAATHRDNNSAHEYIVLDVEKLGTSIDSVEDMKLLLDKIPLDKMSISITINDTVLPIMAFYIVAAEEQGIKPEQLKGSLTQDVLKVLLEKNTDNSPTVPSIKIISDIFEYTSKYMPNFNSIRISGYHMQEANIIADIELAYTLAYGLDDIKKGLDAGMDIDTLAARFSFFWGLGMNHFMEIAKMRAARMLWAKLIKQFKPKNEKSLVLRTHCQTSDCCLTEQDSLNNMARTTIEATAAVFGGTQSLHTSAFDNTIAIPSELSERIARNTQLFLQEETKITKTVDPWAGSYYIEKLTQDIAEKAWKLIEEIEALGGMTKAIDAGIPKLRIEEASAKKQDRIDSNQDIIVGLNKYKLKKEVPISKIKVDNQTVLNQQIEYLNKIKTERDSEKVKTALSKLSNAARGSQENLLNLAIEAARARATLSEINNAIEV